MKQHGFGLIGYVIAGAVAVAIIAGVVLAVKSHFAQDQRNVEKIAEVEQAKGEMKAEYEAVIESKDNALTGVLRQLRDKETEVSGLLASVSTLAAQVAADQEKMDAVRAEADEYMRIFAEHDVPALMDAKPGPLTRKAQAGTERVWQSIEQAFNQ